jgi:hypothetical protein
MTCKPVFTKSICLLPLLVQISEACHYCQRHFTVENLKAFPLLMGFLNSAIEKFISIRWPSTISHPPQPAPLQHAGTPVQMNIDNWVTVQLKWAYTETFQSVRIVNKRLHNWALFTAKEHFRHISHCSCIRSCNFHCIGRHEIRGTVAWQ